MAGIRKSGGAVLAAMATLLPCAVLSAPLAMLDPTSPTATIFEPILRDRQPSTNFEAPALPPHLQRQVVAYRTAERPGTIVIDTANTYLYFVLGNGQAIRYAIGVGREGFTWSGVQMVSRKAEWPDWSPPAEMIRRQQYLPRWVAGGPGNPLGARAIYLGASQYRIHGTNDPSTIGQNVSSGCFRMANEDVIDLYEQVALGAKVIVLPAQHRRAPVDHAAQPVRRPVLSQATSSSQVQPWTSPSSSFAFGLY